MAWAAWSRGDCVKSKCRPCEVREESGEGAALMEAWQDAMAVILVDAARSGAAPGTIHRFDVSHVPVPSRFFHYSTHAFSVAEAVELARAMNQLPSRIILYGIEGRDFAAGERLSSEVAAAAEELVRRIRQELQDNRPRQSQMTASRSMPTVPSRQRCIEPIGGRPTDGESSKDDFGLEPPNKLWLN